MKQRFFRSIADLKFAITIFLIIALFSIIGTVIEQDQLIETYKSNELVYEIPPKYSKIQSSRV